MLHQRPNVLTFGFFVICTAKGMEWVPHNDRPRDARYLRWLRDEVERRYGVKPDGIAPATRGYYGETWKVGAGGRAYFLKMDTLAFHQARFRRSLPVIAYLYDHGADFVGRVIPTREGGLHARMGDAVAGLFEWVDGENVETDETKAAEYQLLSRVYALTRQGFDIPTAVFSDEAAARFYGLWAALRDGPRTDADRALLDVLERFRVKTDSCAARLAHMARLCRDGNVFFYLTHGDAGGNFFAGGGRHYIFDWDEVMYAPLERDAWVMGCYGWARQLFEETLHARGIPCRLRPERLAFYCYHMYFFYLSEMLMVHAMSDQTERIRGYLEDGWILSRVAYADTV